MEQLQLLRIYFKHGQKSRKLSLWKRLWNSSLSDKLLKNAKSQNIYQANVFIANAGYLGYGNIFYKASELPSSQNTVCLELVDNESRLQIFLKKNETDLEEAVSILLHPEILIVK